MSYNARFESPRETIGYEAKVVSTNPILSAPGTVRGYWTREPAAATCQMLGRRAENESCVSEGRLLEAAGESREGREVTGEAVVV